jgi:methylated-DNA-[protein]-cysteine S-methyltransferase
MARRQVLEYLAGRRRRFAFPVGRLHGTAFQRKVWGVTEQIPFGEVRSYQWVAERVGGKQYARAVGMALGANRLPLAIPCHRVVRGDGSLGGFTGGPDIKKKLLALEQRRH